MVDRIDKIVNGKVTKSAALYHRNNGEFYECFEPGQTMNPIWFATLNEVAAFLREIPRRRVRMEPGAAMTSRHIYIDGVPL